MANLISNHPASALTLDEIAFFHTDARDAFYEFFTARGTNFMARYGSDEESVVSATLQNRLVELSRTDSLSVLAAVEAAIRIDYKARLEKHNSATPPTDPVSVFSEHLYDEFGEKTPLERLIDMWKTEGQLPILVTGNLNGALRFRHWLAHGRHWDAATGRKYDFDSCYEIADVFIYAIQQYCQVYPL